MFGSIAESSYLCSRCQKSSAPTTSLFGKDDEEECETLFDCFIYTLKNMEVLERMPFLAKDAVFKKLQEIAGKKTMSEADRVYYDANIRNMRDFIDTCAYAQDEGRAVGLAEGRAAGHAVGLAEGRAEGRAEGEARGKATIILSMLEGGMSPEQVAAITKMSVSDVMQCTAAV